MRDSEVWWLSVIVPFGATDIALRRPRGENSPIEIRPATPDEMGQLGSLGGYVYGGAFGDGPDTRSASANRPEWTLCAFDGARMAAGYCTIPFTMRANGTAIALGGVSAVGTLPEYRRRGLLRRITTQAFEEMYEQGRAVAALWASQAAIYQRYGYAQTTVQRSYTVDTADIGFYDGDNGLGNVRRYDVDDGYPLAKGLYASFVAERMCYLHRSRPIWDSNALETVEADGPVHVAVSRDDGGEPNGYVVYTLRAARVEHESRSQELVVRDLVWLSLDGYRSLWSWIGRHDLVGRVRWDRAPLDDPAPELFVEPRLLHTRDREGLWFRVVAAEAALAGRGYSGTGRVAIEIVGDQLAPWNNATFSLTVDAGGVEVKGVSGGGEVRLSIKALASLYTGYRSARRLQRWGLIDGSPDAIRRADDLFAMAHAPGCPDQF